jgi:hypothetical protein
MARREAVRREERISPTPETLAKLVIDPLLDLDPDHQRAVAEIRQAYSIITAPVAIRRHRLTHEDPGQRNHETVREIELQDRYNDWVDEMKRYRLRVIYILDGIIDHDLPVLLLKKRLPEISDAMALYCRLHPRALRLIDKGDIG